MEKCKAPFCVLYLHCSFLIKPCPIAFCDIAQVQNFKNNVDPMVNGLCLLVMLYLVKWDIFIGITWIMDKEGTKKYLFWVFSYK